MNDYDGVNEILEIDFEVGHTSIIRTQPTTEHNPPRTHDWKLFLRSSNIHGDLNCLIHRCIFYLHPDFDNCTRELKTTPFAIQETGYAGFQLPIDIYFQTKKEPKKYRIDYDLDLHTNVDGQSFREKKRFLRRYHFTFRDPDPEFREKILAAGGKIVDTGPIRSINSNINEKNQSEEKSTRQSPQQKRAASPVSLADGIVHKKVKLDPTIKKKQTPTIIKKENTSKPIVNKTKPKLVPCKSSSILDDKTSKHLPIKESNPSININNSTIENSSSTKPCLVKKLVKSQSTNDIKSSNITTTIKKKVSNLSPSKTNINMNPQVVLKRTINKIPLKTSIKLESTSTSIIKSPSNYSIKQEPSMPMNSTNISSISKTNLKKIPKKTIPSNIESKRSQSLLPSSTSERQSINLKTTQKQQEQSSTTKSKSKRDSSISSVKIPTTSKKNERLSKIKTIKDQSKVQKSSRSPSQSCSELFPSVTTPLSQNDDNHIRTPIEIDRHTNDEQLQLSDESNSPNEQILVETTEIPINQISYSNQSDTHDSDQFIDDEDELPTSLTDDNLRYKLIYIYQRFQLNSIKNLIIFVKFFERNHLIDTSTLSTMKSTNEMFTYDLLTLSPSHINELADNLGYNTMKTKNSID